MQTFRMQHMITLNLTQRRVPTLVYVDDKCTLYRDTKTALQASEYW